MIYLEDYIDAVESLPDSLQRLLTTLHDLDAQVHHPHARLVALLDTFAESHAALAPADRALLLHEIEASAKSVAHVNEERALVAMSAHHAVNNHIARANDNYVAFCSELWSEEQRIERKRTSATAASSADAVTHHHGHSHGHSQVHVEHPAKASAKKGSSSSSPNVASGAHNSRAAAANAGTPANKRARRATANPDQPLPAGRASPHAMHPSGSYPPPPLPQPAYPPHPHAHHAHTGGAASASATSAAAAAMRNSPAPTAAAALAAVASSASSSRNPTPEPAGVPKRAGADKKSLGGNAGKAARGRANAHADDEDDVRRVHEGGDDAMQVDAQRRQLHQQPLGHVARAGHAQRAAAVAAQATTAAQMAAATVSVGAGYAHDHHPSAGAAAAAHHQVHHATDPNADLENVGGEAEAERDPEADEEDADPDAVYCFCRRGIEVGDMIGCDDDRCKFEWFHLVCVGVTTAPEHDQQWFCGDCQKRRDREAREAAAAAAGAGTRRAGAGRRG